MGPYLSSPDKTKQSEKGEGKLVKYAVAAMQGWRNTMEDAHIHYSDIDGDQDTALFGVFDGHGGKEVAVYVSRHFKEELLKTQEYKDKSFGKALALTFQKMDDLLLTPQGQEELGRIKSNIPEGKQSSAFNTSERNAEYPIDQGLENSQAGCTANVALIHKNKLYVANSGDSRSILCVKGKQLNMSEDHKPDQDKEKDRITKAGGVVFNGRVNGNLNLSRALGDLEYKQDKNLKANEQLIIAEPDIQEREIDQDCEFVLMGCDGIWETKQVQEILDYTSEQIKLLKPPNDDLITVVNNVLEYVVAKEITTGQGCDNMSTILVQFKHPK